MPETPNGVVEAWLAQFDEALRSHNTDDVLELFEDDSYWRDFVSFTWNLKTLEGKEDIRRMLNATLENVQPHNWALAEDATGDAGNTEAWVNFDTAQARGHAHLRLRNGKCWTLLTTMQELKGFEEKKGPRRDKGVAHQITRGRKTWLERKEEQEARLGYQDQPYTVIIGGGQGGIGLGARLRRLGVPTIIIEKNDRPGDSWRNRYKSLHLHDPVWYDHLPYMKFPDDWPVFAAKDKIGDWLEHYTRIMELNYWSKTECTNARFDEASREWVVGGSARRRTGHLASQTARLRLGCLGLSQRPGVRRRRFLPGGAVPLVQAPGRRRLDRQEGRGYRLGSNNSAHDICADLWEHGADVTMVQRSSTPIARSESLMDLALGGLYSEEALARGVTTEKADLLFCVPALTASCPKPRSRSMPRWPSGTPNSLPAEGRGLRPGLRGGRLRPLPQVPEARIRLLHRRRRLAAHHRRPGQARQRRSRQDHRQRRRDGQRNGAGSGRHHLRHRLRVHERLAGRSGLTRVADAVGKCWGFGSDTPKDPGPWEANCAICGNPPTWRTSGSTAETCTRAATIPITWRCSSRHGWRDCRRRSSNSNPRTTHGKPGGSDNPTPGNHTGETATFPH